MSAATNLLAAAKEVCAASDAFDESEASEKRCHAALDALYLATKAAEACAPSITVGLDFVSHLKTQIAFSQAAFGPGPRTEGVIDHIRKELREIEAKPDDLTEWIDVVLLACDGAWRAGYTPEQIAEALVVKLAKNMARMWPDWRTAEPGKAIEHDRSAEASDAV